MTIDTTQTKVFYYGTGMTREWPVPFPVLSESHLRLVVTDMNTGRDTPITANYLVEGCGTDSVSVTYPVSGAVLAPGNKLTMYRIVPHVQQMDLENGGAFDAEVIEAQFDNVVMQAQQLKEELDRALKVSVTSDELPDDLMQNLFNAVSQAEQFALGAQQHDESARLSAESASADATLAKESQKLACACADRSEAARDVALKQVETVNGLMETELAKINVLVAANKEDQQTAVNTARKWADEEPGVPVAQDAYGRSLYSARHWAGQAQEISMPVADGNTRGGVRVGRGLTMADTDRLDVAPGDGLEIGEDGRLYALVTPAKLQAAVPAGEIRLLPFRAAHLPTGWYFCNGDRFSVSSPVGQALNALGDDYHWDWGITVENETINLPNLFHSDGRGYFLRAAASREWSGTDWGVGSVQEDAIRNIVGETSSSRIIHNGIANMSGAFYGVDAGVLNISSGALYTYGNLTFDASRSVPTAEENRPLNIGMTPAVYIGV